MSELGRLAAHGALWGLAATIVARLVSVASLAVLARLLAPEEFGLLAFALLVVTWLETLGDLGTGLALIRQREDPAEAAEASFVVSLATGALWTAAAWFAAPLVAGFFENPRGVPVLRVVAVALLLKAAGATHDALCQRAMRFRARLLPELASALVKAAVSIALVAQGHGALGLAWGHVAGTAAGTVLLWAIVPWRPRLRLRPAALKPLLAFGSGMVAVNVIAAVVHHVDLVVVGRALGTTTLGLYQVASRVPDMTITVVLWVVGRALFPALSRVAHDRQQLAAAFTTALRYVSLVTVPTAALLALLAEPLVETLFGSRWIEAAPILGALAVYGGLRSLGTHAGEVLKATGRPGRLALLGLLRGALLIPALAVGVRQGAAGVAWAMAAVAVVMLLVNLTVALRLSQASVADVLGAVQPALGATAVMAFVVMLVCHLADAAPAPVLLSTALAGAALAYLGALLLLAPDVLRQARGVLQHGPMRMAQP